MELQDATPDTIGSLMAGCYDTAFHVILLVSDTPRDFLGISMAHEMTHVLDDQRHGLWSSGALRGPGNGDRNLAWTCVTEGSAVLTQLAYSQSDPAGAAAMANKEYEHSSFAKDIPELLMRRVTAPYLLGVRFLTRGRGFPAGDRVDPADVDRALDDPPVSTEQILHPEKYWDESSRDVPRRIELPDRSAALGEGWALAAHDTLGELQLGMLTGLPLPGNFSYSDQALTGWTHEPTSGWGGDEWQLYRRGDDALVILATAWDTPTDAAEFSAAVHCPPGGVVRHADNDDVVALVVDGRGPGAARTAGDQALLDAAIESARSRR